MNPVRPIAVTGGAASGKSTVAALLRSQLSARLFEADACVHELFTKPAILDQVKRAFPDAVRQGQVQRPILREIILQDASARHHLESILHPAVYAACREEAAHAAAAGQRLVAEIPLLLETGAEKGFYPVVLVAASRAVQEERLRARGIPEGAIAPLLDAQWTVERKLPLADMVLWNDGSRRQLNAQVTLLATVLLQREQAVKSGGGQ